MGRNRAGQTMSDEHNSSSDRYNPQTEKLLRQFLTLESVNAATAGFRHGYERTFGKVEELDEPAKCRHCDYVASTLGEVDHHIRMTGWHLFDPVKVTEFGVFEETCPATLGRKTCYKTPAHQGPHESADRMTVWGR